MNHYQNLIFQIDRLIYSKAKYDKLREVYELRISDLDEIELSGLASLKLEEADRDTCECIHGLDFSINNEFTCSLIKMLRHNNQENRNNFSQVITKNIISYHSDSLQKLIDERCEEYMSDNYYVSDPEYDQEYLHDQYLRKLA